MDTVPLAILCIYILHTALMLVRYPVEIRAVTIISDTLNVLQILHLHVSKEENPETQH